MSVYPSANPAAVRARPIAAAVGLPVARAEKTTLRVLSWEAPESSGSRRCDRRSAHAGQVPGRGTRGGSITLALLAVPRRPPRPYRTTRPAVRVRPRLRPRRARRPPATDGPERRDAPRLSVLRQRFDRGPDPVLLSARDHGGATPGDHLVGRGEAHAAAAANDHDLRPSKLSLMTVAPSSPNRDSC
jgi:hypothetical protein